MSLKKYGIYLEYGPNARLHDQGLGRYLAAFLKATEGREDLRFVIGCPSWNRASVRRLCREEGLEFIDFEFIGPAKEPLLLNLQRLLGRGKKAFRRRRSKRSKLASTLSLHMRAALGTLLSVRGPIPSGLTLLLSFIVTLTLLPVLLLVAVAWGGALLSAFILRRTRIAKGYSHLRTYLSRLSSLTAGRLSRYLYEAVHHAEVTAVLKEINKRDDIDAWYCPTAFWPRFHDILAKRVMCVPDVVMVDFPVPFSSQNLLLQKQFDRIGESIRRSDYSTTYSQHVKWRTLVDRYQKDPATIKVIRHGLNALDSHIRVTGTFDDAAATRAVVQSGIEAALRKSIWHPTGIMPKVGGFRYIFYASQFRPHKNVITLLRAYRFLLQERYCQQKLLLTGNPFDDRDARRFVEENNLRSDVLFLSSLSVQELAACYAGADLAVNPSLSEGGMPFTYTEAISVGTPVLTADIEVTREVITSAAVSSATLFDPYNWHELAAKIETALINKDALYENQRRFYDETLSVRTWDQVVNEHIEFLERVSNSTLSFGELLK